MYNNHYESVVVPTKEILNRILSSYSGKPTSVMPKICPELKAALDPLWGVDFFGCVIENNPGTGLMLTPKNILTFICLLGHYDYPERVLGNTQISSNRGDSVDSYYENRNGVYSMHCETYTSHFLGMYKPHGDTGIYYDRNKPWADCREYLQNKRTAERDPLAGIFD